MSTKHVLPVLIKMYKILNNHWLYLRIYAGDSMKPEES
jgi:hypothetical protein